MKKFLVVLSFLLISLLSRAQILTSSNLPIVVIETDGGVSIPDEPKVLATMKIIWHEDGSRNYLTDIDNPEYLNYDGRIGIELRGTTSQQFLQKKPYGKHGRKGKSLSVLPYGPVQGAMHWADIEGGIC